MDFDVVSLSRLQFALTVMFHYLFPPLTIGISAVLVYLEAMYQWKKDPIYEAAAQFWTQLFAVTFAMGVATGIVMEFQFGTNWALYSRFVGDVFGSALAAEGIFAFFLESGFLAVLVFGWDKVSPLFHLIATNCVAIGSVFSAIWIIVANSWQQTPAGHRIVQMMRDGQPWSVNGAPILRAETVDFWSVVWNPSTVDRLTHTLIAAWIVGAFFILSISASYLLKKKHLEIARRSFVGALCLATFFVAAQWISGHSNAKMVAREQPAKLAAFEGLFQTGSAGLSLFGWPNENRKTLEYAFEIPGFLSFLLTGQMHAEVPGLDRIPKQYWPPVALSYWSYHGMVLIGVFLSVLLALGCWFHWRKTIFQKRWLLWLYVIAIIPVTVANQLGWVAAEVGRQPWTVVPPLVRDSQGVPQVNAQGQFEYRVDEGLLTRRSVSEAVDADQVLVSIFFFSFVYSLLFILWIYILNSKIQKGPAPVRLHHGEDAEALLESVRERIEHQVGLSHPKSLKE